MQGKIKEEELKLKMLSEKHQASLNQCNVKDENNKKTSAVGTGHKSTQS